MKHRYVPEMYLSGLWVSRSIRRHDPHAHFAHRVWRSTGLETASLRETHLRLADCQGANGESLVPAGAGLTRFSTDRRSSAFDGHNGRIVDRRGPAVTRGAQSRERNEKSRPDSERSRFDIITAHRAPDQKTILACQPEPLREKC